MPDNLQMMRPACRMLFLEVSKLPEVRKKLMTVVVLSVEETSFQPGQKTLQCATSVVDLRIPLANSVSDVKCLYAQHVY